MVQLLQTMYFRLVRDKATILSVGVCEDDTAYSTVNEGHRTHEAGFDVRHQYEIFEIVLIVAFACVSLQGEVAHLRS